MRKLTFLEILIATGLFLLVLYAWATTATNYPTGDSDKAGGTFTYSSGSTAFNLVNESPDSNATYFRTPLNSSGGYFLFSFSNFTVPAGSTSLNLTVGTMAMDNASGTNRVANCIKVNGTRYSDANNNNPSNSAYTNYNNTWTTNPNTTAAWTVSDINGAGTSPLQLFGVSGSDWSPAVLISSVWAMIAYTPPSLPTVTTQAATSVTNTTATLNGNITATGGNNPDKEGFVYDISTKSTPGNVAPASSGYAYSGENTGDFGTGTYTKGVTSLSAGQQYFTRAYAHNSMGYAYDSSEASFTTQTTPSVTTNAVSDITSGTATGNGNVTADGGASVTERGVCWNTSTNPTTANSHASNGTGTGVYTAPITSLNASTHYYVRAYAINSVGTAYGSNQEFDSAAPPVSITSTYSADDSTPYGGGFK